MIMLGGRPDWALVLPCEAVPLPKTSSVDSGGCLCLREDAAVACVGAKLVLLLDAALVGDAAERWLTAGMDDGMTTVLSSEDDVLRGDFAPLTCRSHTIQEGALSHLRSMDNKMSSSEMHLTYRTCTKSTRTLKY